MRVCWRTTSTATNAPSPSPMLPAALAVAQQQCVENGSGWFKEGWAQNFFRDSKLLAWETLGVGERPVVLAPSLTLA